MDFGIIIWYKSSALCHLPWRSGLAIGGIGSSVKLSCADSSIFVLSTRMSTIECCCRPVRDILYQSVGGIRYLMADS